jgi:hypothetical protein
MGTAIVVIAVVMVEESLVILEAEGIVEGVGTTVEV